MRLVPLINAAAKQKHFKTIGINTTTICRRTRSTPANIFSVYTHKLIIISYK